MRMGRPIARLPFERTAISPPTRTARLDGRADAGQLPRRSAGPRILHRKRLARGLLSGAGESASREAELPQRLLAPSRCESYGVLN